MAPRFTLRNASGKDPRSILGYQEIWIVMFEAKEIGKLSGSPVSDFHDKPDERGRWVWHATAYWGDARPVPAWGNVRLGGAGFASKESAAAEVLEYQLACSAAGWKSGAWEQVVAARLNTAIEKQ